MPEWTVSDVDALGQVIAGTLISFVFVVATALLGMALLRMIGGGR